MMDGAIVMAGQAFGGTIDVTPRVTTVVLFGEADLAARAAFHDFLGEALETTTPRIDVDLAGLTYLESACLRSLLNAHAAGGGIGTCASTSGVVLQVLGSPVSPRSCWDPNAGADVQRGVAGRAAATPEHAKRGGEIKKQDLRGDVDVVAEYHRTARA